MVNGSHEGHLLAVPGQEGKVFAELDAGGGSGNLSEAALILGLRMRLWIEGFLLGKSAPQEQDDT